MHGLVLRSPEALAAVLIGGRVEEEDPLIVSEKFGSLGLQPLHVD